jgi:SAM-dependent methyltransferase
VGRDCPICASPLRIGQPDWILSCRECGLQAAALEQRIGESRTHALIDEPAREKALEGLRERNFATILDALERVRPDRVRPDRGRLLDVGCAHGWFLRAAARRGWRAIGIEPDPAMARRAGEGGVAVRVGTFPEALQAGDKFEVVAFNDVFEHLPDVHAALRAAAQALVPGGLLIVNLPDARGPFHRAARALSWLGLHGPLERLWQKGFPSPHLSYFTAPLLQRLAGQHRFRRVGGSRLPAVALRGLWSRLRYDRTASFAASAVVYAGTCALLPVLRLLPADISFGIFELDGLPGNSRDESHDGRRPHLHEQP